MKIRITLAEVLLQWALIIAPRDEDGKRLAKYLQAYALEVVDE